MALRVLKLLDISKFYIYNFGYNAAKIGGICVSTSRYSTDINKQKIFHKMVENWDTSIKKPKTSKAMMAYLERSKEHDEFIKKEHVSYQIGKRHLANMMGENPSTFTQADIDRSIEYLFPSGLYDPAARPMMKTPEETFPSRKAAEFDEAGRPIDSLFYTGKCNFFNIFHDVVTHMKDLEKYEDNLISKKVAIDPNSKIDVTGFRWISQPELETLIMENIMEREYNHFIETLERLVSMPYSSKVLSFIEKFRKQLGGQKKAYEIPKPQYDTDGRAFVTTYECLRKDARGNVTVRSPGTGIITINGQDITYFKDTQSREQVSRATLD